MKSYITGVGDLDNDDLDLRGLQIPESKLCTLDCEWKRLDLYVLTFKPLNAYSVLYLMPFLMHF